MASCTRPWPPTRPRSCPSACSSTKVELSENTGCSDRASSATTETAQWAVSQSEDCLSESEYRVVSPPRSFKQGATIWHFSIRHRRCFPKASTRRAGRCPAWPWSSWGSCAGSCACATTAGSRAGTSATAATSATACVPRMWIPPASSSTRSRVLGRPSALRRRLWAVRTSSSLAPATTCAMWRPIPLATSALWNCPPPATPTASCGASTTGAVPRPSSRPTS